MAFGSSRRKRQAGGGYRRTKDGSKDPGIALRRLEAQAELIASKIAAIKGDTHSEPAGAWLVSYDVSLYIFCEYIPSAT